MVKKTKTIALCAMLGLLATGCQKEFPLERVGTEMSNEVSRSVAYTIDGITYHSIIKGDDEWMEFLMYLTELSKEGRCVSCWDKSQENVIPATKEIVTYTAKTEKDAVAWCDMMFDAGYKVTMTYDKDNQQFVCIAIK